MARVTIFLAISLLGCSQDKSDTLVEDKANASESAGYGEEEILTILQDTCPIVPTELTLSRLMDEISAPKADARSTASAVCDKLIG